VFVKLDAKDLRNELTKSNSSW